MDYDDLDSAPALILPNRACGLQTPGSESAADSSGNLLIPPDLGKGRLGLFFLDQTDRQTDRSLQGQP